jgi:hypothetical protein
MKNSRQRDTFDQEEIVVKQIRGLARPLLGAATLVVAASVAQGAPGPEAAEQPTRFERFVVAACLPCVKETHPIARIATVPLKPDAFRPMAAARMTKSGEIGIEVLRAYRLDVPSRQQLALRVSLSLATGAPGEMYRIAVGVLDEQEISALLDAIKEMARTTATAPALVGEETVEVDFHGGSLRVGVLRVRRNAAAYVQAGNLHPLERWAIWEAPTTMYLAVDQLPALADAIGQGAAKIQKLRSGP